MNFIKVALYIFKILNLLNAAYLFYICCGIILIRKLAIARFLT